MDQWLKKGNIFTTGIESDKPMTVVLFAVSLFLFVSVKRLKRKYACPPTIGLLACVVTVSQLLYVYVPLSL